MPCIFQTAAELLWDVTDTMVTALKVSFLQSMQDFERSDIKQTKLFPLALFKSYPLVTGVETASYHKVNFQQQILTIFYAAFKKKKNNKKTKADSLKM